MTTSPVPYHDVHARPWLSADAGRWVDVRVPGWARPVGPAVLLLVAVITAGLVLAPPDPVCTVAAPCGADWVDAAATLAFLPHLVWLFALPELALISGPLLILWMAVPGQWQGGAAQSTANAVVVVALGWGWAAVVVRLRMRRRQRELVLDAAGGLTAPSPVPDDVRPWRRGLWRCVWGSLVCVAAAALVVTVVLDSRADNYPSWSGSHRGPVLTAPSAGPAPDGVRFVAEPADDPTGRQAVALLLAGLGITLLGSGVLSRRRAVALRHAPVPVLRVLSGRFEGRTEIFAADDRDGQRPALSYVPHPAARSRTPLRHALLYGVPAEGGELILVSATESMRWIVEATRSPVRPASPADVDRPPIARGSRPGKAAERRQAAEERVQQALVSMTPADGPVSWRPGPVACFTGVAFFVTALRVLGVQDMPSHPWWYPFVSCFAAAWWANLGLRMITWRITADATGLHVRRRWRTRHLVWTDVTRVRYTEEGKLVLQCRAGIDDVRLGGVGFPWLERRLRRPGRAARAAAGITAMLREPRLRPAGPV